MDLDTCISLRAKLRLPKSNPYSVSRNYGLGAVAVGHKCFVFGGYQSAGLQRPSCYVFIYDTVQNDWTAAETANSEVVYGRVKMSFIEEDVLYVYSWHENRRKYFFAQLDLVEPKEWLPVDSTELPLMESGTQGCYVESRREGVVIDTPIHSKKFVEVVVYKLGNKSWYRPLTTGKPPWGRINHALCSFGNRLFVLGGTMLQKPTGQLDLHILTMVSTRFSWSSPTFKGYTPRRRYLFQATCTANRLFIYGGFNDCSCFEVYSIPDRRWHKLSGRSGGTSEIEFASDWTSGTSENAAVQTANKLWVFGGFQLPVKSPLLIEPAF